MRSLRNETNLQCVTHNHLQEGELGDSKCKQQSNAGKLECFSKIENTNSLIRQG